MLETMAIGRMLSVHRTGACELATTRIKNETQLLDTRHGRKTTKMQNILVDLFPYSADNSERRPWK